MKKSNLRVVKLDKSKILFNYEKKVIIKELILNLKLGYFDGGYNCWIGYVGAVTTHSPVVHVVAEAGVGVEVLVDVVLRQPLDHQRLARAHCVERLTSSDEDAVV